MKFQDQQAVALAAADGPDEQAVVVRKLGSEVPDGARRLRMAVRHVDGERVVSGAYW